MQLTPRKKQVIAVLFVILGGLSLLNANWLAPTPSGALKNGTGRCNITPGGSPISAGSSNRAGGL